MVQQQGVDVSRPTVQQPPSTHAYDPYLKFMRPSKDIGRIAVKALVGVKDFLQKDIPRPDQLFSNFSVSAPKESNLSKLDLSQLKKIVKQSHEILAVVQTAFPLTLFPDKVCLDRSVITITKRSFFWSSSVISIRIEDILNVSTNLGPLFGSLTIASRVMSSVDHYEINSFWRKDAIELKNMIQGYLIAKHSGMDIQKLSTEELVDMVREIGRES